jgi:tetratricopeptide repeat protein
MSRSVCPTALHGNLDGQSGQGDLDAQRILSGLQLSRPPFSINDVTAGCESELQAAVAGESTRVDLPLILRSSSYFRNLLRRAAAGDSPQTLLAQLQSFLEPQGPTVWENSWVRFPLTTLTSAARRLFEQDLATDKRDSLSVAREDLSRFLFLQEGQEWIRVPVSYLLKLALAQALGDTPSPPTPVAEIGRELLQHFLNDNSSPETFSFYVVPLTPETGMGRALATETAQRFLLTQLLAFYANARFGLRESGQQTLVLRAQPAPATEGTEHARLGLVLPRAVHEPVPLWLGPRRGQAPVLPWFLGGDSEAGHHYLEQAVATDGNYTNARLLLAKVYIKQDRYEAARRELEAVVGADWPHYRYAWEKRFRPEAKRLLDTIPSR